MNHSQKSNIENTGAQPPKRSMPAVTKKLRTASSYRLEAVEDRRNPSLASYMEIAVVFAGNDAGLAAKWSRDMPALIPYSPPVASVLMNC
jgi:hypothetical protein